jgi:hypothetical protein
MPTNPSQSDLVVAALAAAAANAVSEWNPNFNPKALPWSIGSIAVVASLFTDTNTQSAPALVLSGLYIPTAKLETITA